MFIVMMIAIAAIIGRRHLIGHIVLARRKRRRHRACRRPRREHGRDERKGENEQTCTHDLEYISERSAGKRGCPQKNVGTVELRLSNRNKNRRRLPGRVLLLADAVDFLGDGATYGLSLFVLRVWRFAVIAPALGVCASDSAWPDLAVA